MANFRGSLQFLSLHMTLYLCIFKNLRTWIIILINFSNKKLDNHPLMKKEVLIQTGITSYLSKINNIEPSDIETLLQLQENNGSLKLL
jgi:hypothetical protein